MAETHIGQVYGRKLGKCEKMGEKYKIPVYSFSGGTETMSVIRVKDMAGKNRLFRVILDDEKGITKCQRLR